jgi:hypothetical protein
MKTAMFIWLITLREKYIKLNMTQFLPLPAMQVCLVSLWTMAVATPIQTQMAIIHFLS